MLSYSYWTKSVRPCSRRQARAPAATVALKLSEPSGCPAVGAETLWLSGLCDLKSRPIAWNAERSARLGGLLGFCRFYSKAMNGIRGAFARRTGVITHYGFVRRDGDFRITHGRRIVAVHTRREWDHLR